MASKLIDRKREFIERGINWDIEFDVGIKSRRILRGHRILFEMGTAYFEQLFDWHDRSGARGPVRIDEMEPEEFKKFQEFLYTHRIKNPIEDLFKMIDIAKKCDVPDLVRHCVYKVEKTFIHEPEPGTTRSPKKSTINLSKVVTAFASRQAETVSAVDRFLFDKGEKVKQIMDPGFDADEFKHMTGPLLMYILSHKRPIVSAINAFKAVDRFVNMEYERRMADLNRKGYFRQPQYLSKSELAKAYIEVLFPRLKLEISSNEFKTVIVGSSILTDDQKCELGQLLNVVPAPPQQQLPVMSLNFPFFPNIPPPVTPPRPVQPQGPRQPGQGLQGPRQPGQGLQGPRQLGQGQQGPRQPGQGPQGLRQLGQGPQGSRQPGQAPQGSRQPGQAPQGPSQPVQAPQRPASLLPGFLPPSSSYVHLGFGSRERKRKREPRY